MTPTQAAYLAGVIDGEGNIGINKRNPGTRGEINIQYWNYLRVSNTDLRLLKWVQSVTEVGTLIPDGRIRGNRRKHWVWHCASKEAVEVLRQVYPFLVIKKEQADVVFGFRETYRPHRNCKLGVSATDLVRRATCKSDLQRLHKGLSV